MPHRCQHLPPSLHPYPAAAASPVPSTVCRRGEQRGLECIFVP
ncbi:hypothetical protein E2C01_093719 [Portunus trituberculatus]|uniref:Uncharacterized protein n=1 Tax=Portunus trituberculatus TaxID=210409 RepID=A0A5B7JQJ5_PORTR|nr:hypothetical protein [Portunus trituberculatus]